MYRDCRGITAGLGSAQARVKNSFLRVASPSAFMTPQTKDEEPIAITYSLLGPDFRSVQLMPWKRPVALQHKCRTRGQRARASPQLETAILATDQLCIDAMRTGL